LEYRLWAGLLNLADDRGRVRGDVTWIKAHVLPYDKGTRDTYVSRALIHIASTDLIRLYEVGGEKYIYFPTWPKWQKPKYPKESKLPAPTIPESMGEAWGKPSLGVGVGVGVERNRRGVGTTAPPEDLQIVLKRVQEKYGQPPHEPNGQ
jgi:hypothetical protein